MKHTLIIAAACFNSAQGRQAFSCLSIIGPLIIVYFLKLLFNTFPPMIDVRSYTMPFTAFIVHFLSFILCAIFCAGTNKWNVRANDDRWIFRNSIIGGYTLGYFGLATVQAITVLAESIWLFNLSYEPKTVVLLFIVIWLLAIVSVMLESLFLLLPNTRRMYFHSSRSSYFHRFFSQDLSSSRMVFPCGRKSSVSVCPFIMR